MNQMIHWLGVILLCSSVAAATARFRYSTAVKVLIGLFGAVGVAVILAAQAGLWA